MTDTKTNVPKFKVIMHPLSVQVRDYCLPVKELLS